MASTFEEPKDLQEMESLRSLEDTITNEKLKELEKLFAAADEDGGGGLDMDEFRRAMRGTMGAQVSDKELDMIFMKVDTNCDGTVDWQEYLTFMLLECREKDQMNVKAKQQFPRYLKNVHGPHRDSIVSMYFIPNLPRSTKPQEMRHGRYASVSTEGIYATWSTDLQLLSTHKIDPSNPENKSLWITDAVYMHDAYMLAACTTNREIIFFDTYGSKFDRISRINRLEECASCINYHVHARSGVTLTGHSTLVWGDCNGGVACITFHGRPQLTALRPKRRTCTMKRLPFAQILAGQIADMTAYSLPGVHADSVRAVTYTSHLGCFISCSKDPSTALFLGDWERKITSSYFQISRGTNTFVYAKQLNVIVTGGDDSCVRIWNPYVPSKPVTVLKGHQSPVLHVAVNESREHVATVGENKEIRIFDLNTQTCIQTFYRRMVVELGPRLISTIYFNAARQALLLATTSISKLEQQEDNHKTKMLMSHSKAITKAKYNKLFNQVVSVGLDSMVNVWNFDTGEKVIQFSGHKVRRHGEAYNVEITTMTFDHTLRRLITADREGTVKLWNFNNGACLRVLPQFDNCEVTSIVAPKQKIVSAGWNKRPTVYVDREEEDDAQWLLPAHREDIVDLAFFPPHTLISASFDGDIVLWSLETGRLLSCLNQKRNSLPCRPSGYIQSGFVYAEESSLKRKKFKTMADIVFKVARHKLKSTPVDQALVLPKLQISNSTTLEDGGRYRKESQLSISNVSLAKRSAIDQRSSGSVREKQSEQFTKEDKGQELPHSIHTAKETRRLSKSVKFGTDSSVSLDATPLDTSESKGLPTPEYSSEEIVTCLLVLQSRENNAETATLFVAYVDGFVRAWSIHHNGGILGKFMAVHKTNEYVTTMCTDEDNYYIVTGDSRGYIKVWDVSSYCIRDGPSNETRELLENRNNQFPFVWWTEQCVGVKKDCWLHEDLGEGGPNLINSFLAHPKSVTTVDFIHIEEEGEFYILSGGSDRSLRLWTLAGRYLGIFGHRCAGPPKKNAAQMIPHDVRKVASATTLMVIHCGQRPGWRLARNTFRWLNRFSKPLTAEISSKHEMSLSMTQTEILENPDDEGTGKSDILGKSYKRKTRHRPLPSLPNLRQSGDAFSPYASLPFNLLAEISPFPTPEVVIDIQQRQERARLEEIKLSRAARISLPKKVTNLMGWRRWSKRDSVSYGESLSKTSLFKSNTGRPSGGLRRQQSRTRNSLNNTENSSINLAQPKETSKKKDSTSGSATEPDVKPEGDADSINVATAPDAFPSSRRRKSRADQNLLSMQRLPLDLGQQTTTEDEVDSLNVANAPNPFVSSRRRKSRVDQNPLSMHKASVAQQHVLDEIFRAKMGSVDES